ncbi:hypothetical protein Mal4_34280 [Maioricimonas rarisocia]|uniref:DUF1501 domain-containing protein n=1 Tax=Maioricimonas rarisocia TaxID=2528026 RepID=A0A517Z9F0_9PLAN|nr:DUF1501 domain-containing protein [Maioricimonas rarisocia]QDU39093.1 hypothetical protein Mal4_34280 [Maioricimonas rarisocia]
MFRTVHEDVRVARHSVSRRRFLHTVSAGAALAGTLSFRDLMSLQAEELRRQGRSMILLWMAGGPSQLETFDPKPNHENGGETKAIPTSVPGIQIASGWEQTAKVMDDIALIRSMTNREGNHQRATYQMHTGYVPSGSVKHPSFAACVAKEIGDPESELPSVVSIGPTVGAGFLGVDYEPFVVNNPGSMPQNVAATVQDDRLNRRLGLMGRLEEDFADRGGRVVVDNHRQLYDKASKLVLSPQTKTFDFADEPQSLRDKYGDSQFGRGCLLARRLVEEGVTFVEVRSGGWDTHQDNFEQIGRLSSQVDPGMATLITDLKQRGMLEKTVVVWMGEFGRTPRINPRGGRDHYPRVFSVAMAGGGIRGGQVIGSSTEDGTAVEDRPVAVGDLFSSICKSLHVDPQAENISPLGRPMRIVDEGEVIDELFG